ncbi:ESX secretion-associated protein EspG [Kutzneria albida]|uniref:ESX secretion-associated protein EspG n=1 Tax=Kutzneria albida DSM 43870 TaxID=1449976 RepID=W5WEL7_9PSEU|nr:ESX secretion-associated protein EspG [Kutzneria albida]AHH99292.1 hypothetical protein KALB_5931 [Kutzneria albida DSM 43870]
MTHFGLVELDLLSAHAGVPFPFPLRVPSFGRIPGERELLLAAAGQTLCASGLAEESGPVGEAAEVVTALREHRGTVHLVLVTGEGAVGVAALVYRSWALVCRQQLDEDPAGTVAVQRVADTALAEHLLALVPEVAPARSMPITLPALAVRRAGAEQEGQLRDLVRDCGGDPQALDRLAHLLPSLSGRGQFGATRRTDTGRTRAGTELSWLDGPSGRLRVSSAEDDWVSVNPLRQRELQSAVAELSAAARC